MSVEVALFGNSTGKLIRTGNVDLCGVQMRAGVREIFRIREIVSTQNSGCLVNVSIRITEINIPNFIPTRVNTGKLQTQRQRSGDKEGQDNRIDLQKWKSLHRTIHSAVANW